ncbi:MAG TPA: zf-HC2 domain-containing protein [Gemmatimonadaceae bacterium]|nr:zf-HC2 domain-containing protein [Gemmatimonadaceae bacterium]
MPPIADDLACQELVELVTGYLEGTLPAQRAPRLAAHLDECPDCARYVEQMRLTVGALRAPRAESLPAGMRDELVRLFRESQRQRGP